jgi:hypothetical protein
VKTPADNLRFGASGDFSSPKKFVVGGKSCILAKKFAAQTPRLRQAAGTLSATGGQRSGTPTVKHKRQTIEEVTN